MQEFRDLQVLSQLAWFDEEFQATDPDIRKLVMKGRNYTLADQKLMGAKQQEIIAAVMPEYRKLAATGQIEISTTPYYHPILPLLCDSNIASVAHPNVSLPPRFRYPQDARVQLEMARRYIAERFGTAPLGLWPSEGSVSDEAFTLAAETGFGWAATDSGVLARTLRRQVGVDAIYRPYRWRQGGRELNVIFRDHFLSDLIGFVYSKMSAVEAADDFVRRIHDNCRPILSEGRDALVPIILDGENAWEYYEANGRPFLRELYRRISEDERMTATTVGDAFGLFEPELLSGIFPGSWISANFDVWIGAEEDNKAWAHLLRAREVYDTAKQPDTERRRLAYEEIMIAEGSDWCWWYGPEHDSANRIEFDQLYRSHLANIYRFLDLTPPEDLSRPILRTRLQALHVEPSGAITATIDGQVTSYFEWIGAGLYRVDERSGSMHGKKFLVEEVRYGSDRSYFYIRVDFHSSNDEPLAETEARFTVRADGGSKVSSIDVRLSHGEARVVGQKLANPSCAPEPAVVCAFEKVLEVAFSLEQLGVETGGGLSFQLSFWQGGLPVDALPQHGWIEMPTTEPFNWLV